MTAPLRRRIQAAAGLLIALQVVGTVLGFASWMEVQRACAAVKQNANRRF